MRITKKIKAILTSVCSVIMASACCLGVRMMSNVSAQTTESDSAAVFLAEDRSTLGTWYYGETGKKNEDGTSTRVYGTSGMVIMYQWAVKGGQPFKEAEDYNDFSENSKCHYVEYPGWVQSITGDIQSCNDTPHGYWANDQMTLEEFIEHERNAKVIGAYYKRLLPYDSEMCKTVATEQGVSNPEKIYVANGQFSLTDMNYTVNVSDNEWHTVSIYVGHPYARETGYSCTQLNIRDLSGNDLATRLVDDYHGGVYVTFAVKGSFVIHQEKPKAGTASLISVFFDELEKDETLSGKNFKATKIGPKTVKLTWESNNTAAYTSIYRREINADSKSEYDLLAVVEPGQNEYIDEGKVAKTYEYAFAFGLKKSYPASALLNITPYGKIDNCVPDFTNSVTAKTAEYKATKIVFNKSSYLVKFGRPLILKATVYKQGDDGEINVPYSGREVKFALGGDNVYTYDGVQNMNADLGTYVTDENGEVKLSYEQPYVGDYEITAEIEIQSNPDNEEEGFDSTKSVVAFTLKEEATTSEAPFLYNISEAIKPGETVTITGYNLTADENLTVAYAPNRGTVPGEYNEEDKPENCKYLGIEDLLVSDTSYSTGLMFVFPKTEAAGTYDFWVKTSEGWSNGITLNGTRPLYISQEGAYEGLPIEIVGRNLFESEYGVGTEEAARKTVKVKLVNKENPNESYVVGIENGVRYTAEESVTGKEVNESNAYKITFKTPRVATFGVEYDVYVAADGIDFRIVEEPQTLTIYEKKAQSWNTTVFGEAYSEHIGNDPLDLQVYWAQDFNYNNVQTMTVYNDVATDTASAETYAKRTRKEMDQKVSALTSSGGGVLYFPAGDYYIWGGSLPEKVIYVGAGADKTTLHIMCGAKGSYIKTTANYVGIAKLAFVECEYSTYMPDIIINLSDSGMASSGIYNSVYTNTSYNKFITDCSFETYREIESGQRAQPIHGGAKKNVVMQNIVTKGKGGSYNLSGVYSYGIVRNCDVYMTLQINAMYCFIENVKQDSYYTGHGLTIRSNCYVGNCYVTRAGTYGEHGDGEVILAECPNGYFSTGTVLSADSRSITYARTNGTQITNYTRMDYRYLTAAILDGKGAGQMRHIKTTGGGTYGNVYEFVDNERDWDIIPDHTSKVSFISPHEGDTIYRVYGVDCSSEVALYGTHTNTVVAECYLKDTGGVGVWGWSLMSSGRAIMCQNVRVENNTIVNWSYKNFKANTGAVHIHAERAGGQGYETLQHYGVAIRYNDIYSEENEEQVVHGINVGSLSERSAKNETSGDVRFITIESNRLNNTQWGVKVRGYAYGVVIRNNEIGKTELGTIIDANPVKMVVSAEHTLYVNGEKSDLSGEYRYNTELPADEINGKCIIGWAYSAEYADGDELFTKAFGNNTTLYAVFGYKVTFMYNYSRDGVDRGAFNTVTTLNGSDVKQKVEDYGDPFRSGYTFGGWYTDEACTQAFDVNQSLSESVTVYAKWINQSAADANQDIEKKNNNVGLYVGIVVAGVLVVAGAVGGVIIFKKKRSK